MTDKVTTFTAFHDAMAEELKARIPVLATVDAYEESPSEQMETPAVLVGVEEMEAGRKVSGGRIAMNLYISAYCLLSTKTPRAALEILNMAASAASVVNGNRWGMGECVELPKAVTALPGVFERGGKGLHCWVVSWQQTIHLGEKWTTPEGTPHPIYLKSCHEEMHRLEDFPNEPT